MTVPHLPGLCPAGDTVRPTGRSVYISPFTLTHIICQNTHHTIHRRESSCCSQLSTLSWVTYLLSFQFWHQVNETTGHRCPVETEPKPHLYAANQSPLFRATNATCLLERCKDAVPPPHIVRRVSPRRCVTSQTCAREVWYSTGTTGTVFQLQPNLDTHRRILGRLMYHATHCRILGRLMYHLTGPTRGQSSPSWRNNHRSTSSLVQRQASSLTS